MLNKSIHSPGRIRISLQAIFYTVVFAVNFPPTILYHIVSVNHFLNIVRLFLCIVLVIYSLAQKTVKFTIMEILLFVFAGWGLIVTFVNTPERLYQYAAGVGFKIVAIVFLVKNMSNKKLTKSIREITIYFTILIWINALLMILYPKGIIRSSIGATVERACWLFGSKNQIALYAIPVFLFLYLDSVKNKKAFNWATIAIFMVEAMCMGSNGLQVMGGSTTALFVMISFVMVVVFHGMKIFASIERVFTIPRIAIFSIIFCACIWYISWNGREILNGSLNNILSKFGKDTTFSARNIIWLNTFNSIMQHPVIGCGFREFYFVGNGQASSIYSFWGSTLLYYGITGVAILIAIFVLCDRTRSVWNKKTETLQFVSRFSIFLLMIFGLVNEIEWHFVILLLELCNHSEKLIS